VSRGLYQYGFAMQELSLPVTFPEETAAMAVTFPDRFPAREYPHLAELTTGHCPAGRRPVVGGAQPM